VKPIFSKGRVNLIGEHIDYCGYAVHPMAIDQDIIVAVSKIDEDNFYFSNNDERYEDAALTLDQIRGRFDASTQNTSWWNYALCGIKGVLEEVVSKNSGSTVKNVGLQCLFDGTIPPSAGLSR